MLRQINRRPLAWLLPEVLLVAAAVAAAEPLDFESPGTSSDWTAEGGTVEVTAARARQGARSLRFAWRQAGAALVWRGPEVAAGLGRVAPADLSKQSLALWLRWPRPVRDVLRVELRQAGQVVAAGWWGLEFAGWRALLAPLETFGLTAGEAVDEVRLLPPGAQGELHLDWVQAALAQRPWRDPQHPWVSDDLQPLPAALARPDDWREVRLSTADFAAGRPWLPARQPREAWSAAQRGEVDRLTQRLAGAPLQPGRGRGVGEAEVTALTTAVRQIWGITRDAAGALRGVGTSASLLHNPPGGRTAAEYVQLLERFAKAARQANAAEWTALGPLLAELVAYAVDQGLAMGGGFAEPFGAYGLRDHLGAFRDLRGCLPDPALRRELVLQAVDWLTTMPTSGSLSLLGPRPFADTDLLHGYHNYFPGLVACLDDPVDRWQLWQAYTRGMEQAVLSFDLTEPDGGMYHHGIVHHGYSSYTFGGLVNALAPFQSTSLRVSPPVLERLHEVARWLAWTTHRTTVPPNLYARAGAAGVGVGAEVYWSLAQFGSVDRRDAVDRELAGLFLAKNTNASHPALATLTAAGIEPLRLTGHRSQNSMGDALHRRADWLVAIAGTHRQRAGCEVYGWLEDGSNYAANVLCGSALVVSRRPDGSEDPGFDQRGWQWSHWPNTTAVVRGPRELFAQYTWFGNQRDLAGSVTLDGDGVWAMDLAPTNSLQEVSCRKSAFCFGNRLTFVTSDVRVGAGRPVVTTLYQTRLGDVGAPGAETRVDGQPATGDQDVRLSTDRPHALLDGRGHGYLTFPGGGELVVRRQDQSWLYLYRRYLKDPARNPKVTNSTRIAWAHPGASPPTELPTPQGGRYPAAVEDYYQPTTGRYATAWFDHGRDPAATGDCAYTLLPQTTPEDLAAAARAAADPATAPTRLLRRRGPVHAVYDAATSSHGYAFFEATKLTDCGPVLEASRPCFALVRPATDALRVAVASSDGLTNGTTGVTIGPGRGGVPPAAGTPLILTLAGAWRVAATTPAACQVSAALTPDGRATTLTCPLPWRLTLTVTLRRVGA